MKLLSRAATNFGDDDDGILSGGVSGPYNDCGDGDTFEISVFKVERIKTAATAWFDQNNLDSVSSAITASSSKCNGSIYNEWKAPRKRTSPLP